MHRKLTNNADAAASAVFADCIESSAARGESQDGSYSELDYDGPTSAQSLEIDASEVLASACGPAPVALNWPSRNPIRCTRYSSCICNAFRRPIVFSLCEISEPIA